MGTCVGGRVRGDMYIRDDVYPRLVFRPHVTPRPPPHSVVCCGVGTHPRSTGKGLFNSVLKGAKRREQLGSKIGKERGSRLTY